MFFSAVSRSSWPLIQAVMSFQNVPAPTSPGIWSEPSNRNAVALVGDLGDGLASISFGYSDDVEVRVRRDEGAAGAARRCRCRSPTGPSSRSWRCRCRSACMARSPPPTTGFSPPAVAGGKPKTPTLASRSARMLLREEAGDERALVVHPALRAWRRTSGCPRCRSWCWRSPLRPPRTLPSVNSSFSNSSAACWTSGRVELDLVGAPTGCRRRRRCTWRPASRTSRWPASRSRCRTRCPCTTGCCRRT